MVASKNRTSAVGRVSVKTKKGIVCSSSPLAGAIGARVLRAGGNAVDAAIAVAAAEAVTLPPMCGMGGEVFALVYDAKTESITGVGGGGRAPLGASREYFIERGYEKMPTDGPLCPSVPGEVDAWETMANRFGTMSLAELMAPAIELAEEGFPLPRRIGHYFTSHVDKLKKFPTSARVYVKPDGTAYAEGDVLVQKDLARSMRMVAEGGAEEFYRGALAKEIAAGMADGGGLMNEEDLAGQKTEIYQHAPSVEFHGHTVHATALPSQGVLTLELLSLLDGFDLASTGHNTAETVHTMVESKRLAFTDRLAYVGDPEVVEVPMDLLLSKGYAERRRKLVDPDKMADIVPAGELSQSGGPNPSTSYFCVMDSEGNAVSFIHSLSMYYGCGFVAGNTGILLNDRTARGFYLDEGHVNVIAPGKRTINTIHNYMVTQNGKLVIVGGTPGGDNQPQWNAQVLSNIIDHGMDVQEAADAPRWTHFPGTDPRSADRPLELRMEDGFDEDAIAGLQKRGHKIAPYPEVGTPGAVQLIHINHETGVHTGGTDGRCDGFPIPE
jgi:gamma-glutamyltranspeptidase / glutathione hydrolase